MDLQALTSLVRRAFAQTPRPPDDALVRSDEGDEPRLVARDFAGKDWRALDAAFLEAAPDGYASALSFLSDAALRYFLPAYLLADLAGGLDRVEPALHLWNGFTDAQRTQPLNPQRYGALTAFEAAEQRFQGFSREEAAAVVAYLEHVAAADPDSRPSIEQALRNYWRVRNASP